MSVENNSSPLTKKRRKISTVEYKKRVKRGLNTISSIIYRVILSRKKIILDVLEEIKLRNIEVVTRKSFKNERVYEYREIHKKYSSFNSKTEPSTEIEQQVFDNTDLDYYFLEKLEKMRDNGVQEEYDLIAQEEQYSLERADQSLSNEGYCSNNEQPGNKGSKRILQNINKGSKDMGNGILADYEEEEEVYYCKNGDIMKTMKKNPNSVHSFDEMGNSSILTMELKSLLKE